VFRTPRLLPCGPYRYNGSDMIARTYTYTVVLEADDETGGFVVDVPALPGCHTEADTRVEAIAMAQDAITGYIESLLSHDEPIPIESNPAGPVLVTVTVKTDVHTRTTAA
jgi:antitoxin HicB